MAELRYAEALNQAMDEEMARDENVILIGEDIGIYGGVFRVTKDLQKKYGKSRVRDTPISEQVIAGLSIGASMMGMKPVAEIMFADFLPLVVDALVNQASMMNYSWAGQVTLPFVLRTQGGAGAGAAAQHSKSLEAMVTMIPGIKVVMPTTPADAKGLLKSAIRDPNPVVFLEHKLLYNTKGEVPDGEHLVPIGKAEVVREGNDVTIVATSRMVIESLAAAELLAKDGISCEVIDPRTLRPLDTATIVASVEKTHRAVVVNEAWRFGGYGAEVAAMIAEEAFDWLDAPVGRIGIHDLAIPFAKPLEEAAIPNAGRIAEAVRATLA